MFSVRGRGRKGHQGERPGGVSGSEFRFKLQNQGETSAREQPDQARAQMQYRSRKWHKTLSVTPNTHRNTKVVKKGFIFSRKMVSRVHLATLQSARQRCFYCNQVFTDNRSSFGNKVDAAFVTEGFRNWKKALEKFAAHQNPLSLSRSNSECT